jgi:hypothetical protein
MLVIEIAIGRIKGLEQFPAPMIQAVIILKGILMPQEIRLQTAPGIPATMLLVSLTKLQIPYQQTRTMTPLHRLERTHRASLQT